VSPLVALLLIGFLFVIALCLTIWAALSWVAAPRRPEAEEKTSYVPLTRGAPHTGVWRAGTATAMAGTPTGAAAPARSEDRGRGGSRTEEQGAASARQAVRAHVDDDAVVAPQRLEADSVRVRQRRNDDYRGANASVTQRPNLDDAFDRFLDHERKDRR